MDGFEFVSSLVGSLAWPLVALAVIVAFHAELADLIKRLRKGKLAGIEVEAGELGEKIKDKLEMTADAPATVAMAGAAHGVGQAMGAVTTTPHQVAEANATPPHVRYVGTGSFTADAVLRRLPRATTIDELAEGVARYVEARTVPSLRALSTGRIDREKELFAAVLELQTVRAQGGRPADPARLSQAIEIIRTFWVHPDELSDADVVDATVFVRGLTGEMARP